MVQLKDRIHGQVTIGGWLQSADPQVAEAMASCGFDWIAVDLEHGAHDLESVEQAYLAFERRGVASFARLPSADPYLARRLLDNGAAGIIVPVVESAEAFAEFAAHCYYPPRGKRGVGLSRVNTWGDEFDEYFRTFEPVLVPQIESIAGVQATPALLELPYVDAIFVGPYDLSASLGKPGDFEDAAFVAAMAELKALAAIRNVAMGVHQVAPDIGKLQERIEEGYRFLAFGTDLIGVKWAFQGVHDLAR